MKIFGQIVAIESLALIISLPNQLFGHVPLTNISAQFSAMLEKIDEDKDSDKEDEEEEETSAELSDIFTAGQYVRATVVDVHAANTTDILGLSKSRDDVVRASRRVELSLSPDKVNAGVQKADLNPGFVRNFHTMLQAYADPNAPVPYLLRQERRRSWLCT
jgi:rRNA biogenesis protein RRP5